MPIELIKAKITVITDVTNLLCGKEGASFVFGPQKGLKENELAVADQAMHDFYMRFAPQVIEASGSSAGGGMGAGLLAFASGKIVSGIDYVLDLLEFDTGTASRPRNRRRRTSRWTKSKRKSASWDC